MRATKETVLRAMENHRGVYPDEELQRALHDAECHPYVVPIPRDMTARARFMGNMLVQICLNNRDVDGKLRLEVCALAESLSYLLNSSSFHDGTLHDFDKQELDRKLKRFRRDP